MGSQTANHEIQSSRALMSQGSYNQLLGPPLQEIRNSITHFTDWASPPRSAQMLMYLLRTNCIMLPLHAVPEGWVNMKHRNAELFAACLLCQVNNIANFLIIMAFLFGRKPILCFSFAFSSSSQGVIIAKPVEEDDNGITWKPASINSA